MKPRLKIFWLELRRRRYDGGLERECSLRFQLPEINRISAGGVQNVFIRPAEGEVGDFAVGGWNDADHAASLIADLNADAGGDIQPAVAIDAHTVVGGVVRPIGNVEVVKLLLIGQRSVGLNLIAK